MSLTTGTQIAVGPPAGIIAIWTGALEDIPPGWVLCDSNNGTPELTDRYITCAGTLSVGTGWGANSVQLTTTQIPSHSHGNSDTNTSDSHSHTIGNTGSGGGHKHNDADSNSSGAHTHSYQRASGIFYRLNDMSGNKHAVWSSSTSGEAGSHKHDVDDTSEASAHNHPMPANTNNSSDGGHSHTLGTTGETGSDTVHENRPPSYAVYFIMKV